MCLIVLLGGNNKNADFFTYQWLYSAHIPYGEPGYQVLTRLGPMLGLNYQQFRLILTAIFMIVLYRGVQKLTPHTAGFMAFYFCYPFFLDLIQLRNFMMMALLVYASHFLLEKTYRNLALFTLFVLLGASLQVLGLLYLLVIPLYYFDAHNLWKIGLLTVVFLLSVVVMVPVFSQMMLAVLSSLHLNHLSLYFVQKVRLGYIPFWIFSMFDLAFMYYSYQYLAERQLLTARKRRIIWLVFTFTVVGVLTMPLYTFEFSFARALRDVLPFMVIGYLVTLDALPRRHYLRWLYIGLFITYMLALVYFEMVPLLQDTIIPAFSHNWLLGS
ncbi:EpsG family protein [Loigolactobacillus binensis]|uniref:EpsG family protein n=1 Tax=Loigolactobacillus binensis TaxID=2559922 RepID=A0ABW3EHA5_9LACO|nr:EpsG family protein [Loigolactobacillus binensis]